MDGTMEETMHAEEQLQMQCSNKELAREYSNTMLAKDTDDAARGEVLSSTKVEQAKDELEFVSRIYYTPTGFCFWARAQAPTFHSYSPLTDFCLGILPQTLQSLIISGRFTSAGLVSLANMSDLQSLSIKFTGRPTFTVTIPSEALPSSLTYLKVKDGYVQFPLPTSLQSLKCYLRPEQTEFLPPNLTSLCYPCLYMHVGFLGKYSAESSSGEDRTPLPRSLTHLDRVRGNPTFYENLSELCPSMASLVIENGEQMQSFEPHIFQNLTSLQLHGSGGSSMIVPPTLTSLSAYNTKIDLSLTKNLRELDLFMCTVEASLCPYIANVTVLRLHRCMVVDNIENIIDALPSDVTKLNFRLHSKRGSEYPLPDMSRFFKLRTLVAGGLSQIVDSVTVHLPPSLLHLSLWRNREFELFAPSSETVSILPPHLIKFKTDGNIAPKLLTDLRRLQVLQAHVTKIACLEKFIIGLSCDLRSLWVNCSECPGPWTYHWHTSPPRHDYQSDPNKAKAVFDALSARLPKLRATILRSNAVVASMYPHRKLHVNGVVDN